MFLAIAIFSVSMQNRLRTILLPAGCLKNTLYSIAVKDQDVVVGMGRSFQHSVDC